MRSTASEHVLRSICSSQRDDDCVFCTSHQIWEVSWSSYVIYAVLIVSGSPVADVDAPLPSSDLFHFSAPHLSSPLLHPAILVLKPNFKVEWIECF